MDLYTRRDGVIVDASAEVAKLLNVAARSLEGRQLHLFVDRDRPRIDATIDVVLNGAPVAELEIRVRPREKKPLHARVVVQPDPEGTGLVLWRFRLTPTTGAS